MTSSSPSDGSLRPRWGWRLLLAGLLLLGVWVTWFDSHNVVQRFRWHQEVDQLRAENETLRQRIRELRSQLKEGFSNADIERIAREEYGMHRPEETVYRVTSEPLGQKDTLSP